MYGANAETPSPKTSASAEKTIPTFKSDFVVGATQSRRQEKRPTIAEIGIAKNNNKNKSRARSSRPTEYTAADSGKTRNGKRMGP